MSYCRWSSDFFRCDIYAYESTAGFEIHVAGRKLKNPPPVPVKQEGQDWSDFYAGPEFQAWQRAYHEASNRDDDEWEDLGGPFDGEEFVEPDFESYRERMLELRALGYRFPDDAIEEE
jgi:hypothetical protein